MRPLDGPAPAPSAVSLRRQVVALALWPFLEQMLSFLVGFVDTALAGRLSVEATNAVGAGAYVLWMVSLFHGAVGVGATALVARGIGAGRVDEARHAMGQAVALAAGMGIVTGLVLWLLSPWLGWLIGLRGESLDLATVYLRVLALSAPFHAVLFTVAACLRAAGDTRRPFQVMLVVNVVNAVMSILLVAGPEPLGGHGVVGLALGTLLAWIVGAGLSVRLVTRREQRIRLTRGNLRPERVMMRRILRVGVPNLMENFGLWMGNFMVLAVVGNLPDKAAVAAHTVAIRVEALSYLPGFALAVAASTLAGQYLGRGDPATARRAVWLCLLYGASFMGLMGAVFILIPEALVRLVTNQPALLAASPQLLFITGWAQVGFGAAMILSGGLRGAGDTRASMLITFGCTYLVRLPFAYLLGVTFGYGLAGVWVVLAAELVLRGFVFFLRFLGDGWTRVEV
jgi:putative MATE family efflux protein